MSSLGSKSRQACLRSRDAPGRMASGRVLDSKASEQKRRMPHPCQRQTRKGRPPARGSVGGSSGHKSLAPRVKGALGCASQESKSEIPIKHPIHFMGGPNYMLSAMESHDFAWFNRLPTIEDADLKRKASNKLQTALAVLAPIFINQGISDHWGICLLHRHWPLHEGEIPVHVKTQCATGSEWICEPRSKLLYKTSCPSVLRIASGSDRQLEPLEFSTDPAVCSAYGILMDRPQFQNQFCAAMREHSLDDTFGLIAIREATGPDRRLVEFNYEGRISVVRDTAVADFSPDNLIQTCWRFSFDTNAGSCIANCFTDCTVHGDGSHSKDHVKTHSK